MEKVTTGLTAINNFIVETFSTPEMMFFGIFCALYLLVYKYIIKRIKISE